MKAKGTKETTAVETAVNAIEAATDAMKSSMAANFPYAFPPIEPLPAENPEEVQALQEQANDAEEWIFKALTWLYSYEDTTQLYKSTHPSSEQTAKVYRRERETLLNGGEKNETDEERTSRLARRRGAWIGLLRFEFSRNLKTQENVRNLLDQLVKQGTLTEDLSGPFRAYGRTFSLPQSVGFNPQTDATRISRAEEALKELLERVRRERIAQAENKAKELRSQSRLSLDQLLAGESGMHCLNLWHEDQSDGGRNDRHDDDAFLVRSDGQRVFPVDAAGSPTIENAVQELKERKRFLLFFTIGWSKPPKEIDTDDPDLNPDVRHLWSLIRKGVCIERMRNLATISPENFFSGKLGISLLRFKGVWRPMGVDNAKATTNIFFLIERKPGENGTPPRLRIAEVPSYLQGFFAQCMDEYPDEERFSNCPDDPLGRLLRKIKKQVVGEPVKVAEAGNGNGK